MDEMTENEAYLARMVSEFIGSSCQVRMTARRWLRCLEEEFSEGSIDYSSATFVRARTPVHCVVIEKSQGRLIAYIPVSQWERSGLVNFRHIVDRLSRGEVLSTGVMN